LIVTGNQLIFTNQVPPGVISGYTAAGKQSKSSSSDQITHTTLGQPSAIGGLGGLVYTDPNNGAIFSLAFQPTGQSTINCTPMPVGFSQTAMCDTVFLGPSTATTIFPGQNNEANGVQGGLATGAPLYDNAAAREVGAAGKFGQVAVGLIAVGAGLIL
jgi:hypothetical protein